MLSASGAELAADPLNCQGFDVLKAELPVEPGHVDAIQRSKYDTNGLPSGPDPDGPRDPRRQQTIDASGTAKWNQELRPRLAGCLRARRMLACSSGEKAIVKMRAIKSLLTPGYDAENVDPQEGDQEAHADEDLAGLARYMDGKSLKDMPLSVIVAFMPGTRLRIRRLDTHKWVVVHLEPATCSSSAVTSATTGSATPARMSACTRTCTLRTTSRERAASTRAMREGLTGVKGMSGYGKDGWGREGGMYAHSCESNAHIPRTCGGPQAPLVCSTVLLFCTPHHCSDASMQCFVLHTQCGNQSPRP